MKVTGITAKMRENRLRNGMKMVLKWYGHVEKKENDEIFKKIREVGVVGGRGRDRPMKDWVDVIRVDI